MAGPPLRYLLGFLEGMIRTLMTGPLSAWGPEVLNILLGKGSSIKQNETKFVLVECFKH